MLQSVVSCGLWFVLFLLWYALRNKQPIYIHEINKAADVNTCHCEKLKKQLLVTFHSQYANHIVLTLLNGALCMVQSVVSCDLCFFSSVQAVYTHSERK